MLRQYRMTSSCRCIMVISAVESLFHLCCVLNTLLFAVCTVTVINKSVFSLVPRLSTWHCPHLLLSAVAAGCACNWYATRGADSCRSVSPAHRALSSAAVDQCLLPTGHCRRQLSISISCPQGTVTGSCRSVSHAHRALSSKLIGHNCCCQSIGRTDRCLTVAKTLLCILWRQR